MLPAQDKMPAGGLENLIANPWKLMEVVKKSSKQFVDKKIKDLTAEDVLGILAADMSGKGAEEAEASAKPWKKKAGMKIFEEDITGNVNIVTANQIFPCSLKPCCPWRWCIRHSPNAYPNDFLEGTFGTAPHGEDQMSSRVRPNAPLIHRPVRQPIISGR